MFVIWLKKYDMDYMSTAIITAWEGHVEASKMSFSQRLCWFLVFAASGKKKTKKHYQFLTSLLQSGPNESVINLNHSAGPTNYIFAQEHLRDIKAL